MFRRSSKCANGTCVEVAVGETQVLVRDSKQNDGPVLSFTPDEWQAFVAGVKGEEFEANSEDDYLSPSR